MYPSEYKNLINPGISYFKVIVLNTLINNKDK